MFGTLLALALALNQPAAVVSQQNGDSLVVDAVQFYRASLGQTRVRAFVQLPYALLTPARAGGVGELRYRVEVRILDSAGAIRFEEGWDGTAPGTVLGTGGFLLETLEFLVPAGKYRLEVSVSDGSTGQRYRAYTELRGYDASPGVSEVLLSPAMRPVSARDSLPQPGELRIGNVLVTAAAEVALSPLSPTLHYLFEAYPDGADRGTVWVAVRGAGPDPLVTTQPARLDIPPQGGVMVGQLDLAGLPEGRYQLELSVSLGDSVAIRTNSFRMTGLHEALARDSVRRAAARITDDGYFAAMNEAQLDSAKAPLIYIAGSDDNLRLFDDLSVQAKRAYLIRFWKKRDASPGVPRNEVREAFYAAVAYANREFGESDRGLAGWQSDRGRIFAKYGMSDDILDRPRSGQAPPYQVWQYFRGKYRYYIFADLTGFGGYVLLHTNDLTEPRRSDWRERLTIDAVLEVQDHLGISFINGTGEDGF